MKILYLDLDTLRPDHLGCYGYHRNTSPNLDRLAAAGARFTDVYCADAPCCPSRAALMTGRFGIHNGLVGHGGTAGDLRLEGPTRGFRDRLGHDHLAAVLRRGGFHTASISPFPQRHGAWWFHAGFHETYDTAKCGMESAEEVTPTVLDWIARHSRTENWFLHVNYWDPHVPFRVPPEFGNPFADQPLPAWLTEEKVARHAGLWGLQMPHRKELVYRRYAGGCRHGIAELDFPPLPRNPQQIRTLADVRQIVDGYDCGIRYLDEHIGRVLAALEQAGMGDDLAIIISSDHGENLGELGIYGDHVTADAITHRIPLIIRWPGYKPGAVCPGLRYHLDLPPTIAELLTLPPAPSWEGQSFAAALRQPGLGGRDHLVLSSCFGTCQRAVRFGDFHYVRTYHDGYNWFPAEMLFDIERDPHEEHDLAAARPEVCAQAARLLDVWHDRMMRTMPDGYREDPLQTVLREGGPSGVRGALPEYLDWLEKQGWIEAAKILRQRHPRDCPSMPVGGESGC